MSFLGKRKCMTVDLYPIRSTTRHASNFRPKNFEKKYFLRQHFGSSKTFFHKNHISAY